MTELVMCRRGPERQAGAARPDLVNPAILPSAQPPEPIPIACAGAIWKDFQRRTCQAAGQPGARSHCSTVNGDAHPVATFRESSGRSGRAGRRSGADALAASARAGIALVDQVVAILADSGGLAAGLPRRAGEPCQVQPVGAGTAERARPRRAVSQSSGRTPRGARPR